MPAREDDKKPQESPTSPKGADELDDDALDQVAGGAAAPAHHHGATPAGMSSSAGSPASPAPAASPAPKTPGF